MEKKKLIPILIIVTLIAVLFVPIPTGVCKDGGTRVYSALTYKIVNWNRLTKNSIYKNTKVYFFPSNFKELDELWQQEEPNVEISLKATVIEMNGTSVIVRPVDGEPELITSDKISFSINGFDKISAEVGSTVEITYKGPIMETYPAQINATGWKISSNLKH